MRAFAAVSFAVIIALSPTSVCAVSQSSGDPQALELLAKHKSFVGWQLGDGTFQTMRVTGNITDEKGNRRRRSSFYPKACFITTA